MWQTTSNLHLWQRLLFQYFFFVLRFFSSVCASIVLGRNFFKRNTWISRDFLEAVVFLPGFYKLSDLLWQEGLIIDFLQKKSADRWLRTSAVFTGYLFSERVVLDVFVRFYIDYVWVVGRGFGIFEVLNISWLLLLVIVLLLLLFLIVGLLYLAALAL